MGGECNIKKNTIWNEPPNQIKIKKKFPLLGEAIEYSKSGG